MKHRNQIERRARFSKLLQRDRRGSLRLASAPLLLLLAAEIIGCKGNAPVRPEAAATPASTASTSSPSSQQSGSLADRLNAVASGQTGEASKPSLPDWKPAPADVSSPAIPLQQNLIVVTAVSTGDGDYESYKHIAGITPTQVRLDYSAVTPVPIPPGTPTPPPDQRKMKNTSCTRLIDVADLASAHVYNETFCGNRANPEHFPGSTAISASTELLNQLRANQPVDFHFANTQGNLLTMLGQQLSSSNSMGDMLRNAAAAQDKGAQSGMSNCTLHRVEAGDLLVPVLLNDQPVELPAIHASCTTADQVEAHLYYLDQPSNPITLAFQIGSEKSRLQVIKIILPPPPPPAASGGGGGAQSGGGGGGGGQGSQMEQALAQKKPVEIYGIYFDFNSSVIKPESEVVLRQIAAIMQKNPDWKLSVSGHTDNIGDDNFNLGLSQRRAAAVKDALVTRYKIAPDRLVTAGYGASQPIDTNKTLEGRARNRRVELQRQ